MFFESAVKGKNSWWRYVVMVLVSFGAAMTIGNIPILIATLISGMKNPEAMEINPENPADLSSFGLESNLVLVLIVIAFLVGLVAFALLIKPLNNRSFKSVINGRDKIRWNRIFFSFLLWFALLAFYLIVFVKLDPGNYELINSGKGLIVLAILALIFIPFQTSFEEVLFRGYLMQGFGLAFRNKWAPLIFTSILFGLMHVANPEIKEFGFLTMMPQYITFGFVFGLVTVLDDGIELALGAHAANNVFLSIFVTQKSAALQTNAMFEQQIVNPWPEFLSLLIVSAIFVGILFMVYKWKFKESFRLKI